MHPNRIVPALICSLVVALSTLAADSSAEPKTLLTERGKLLVSDDFNQPLSKDWRIAKGKWEMMDGAIRGTELKADMHGAVTRRTLAFQNVVIQYSFKLDGAKSTSLSVNDPKGHNCRVAVTPAGFTVRKDSHDHNKQDKAVILENRQTPIKAGEWHMIVIEILGKEMLASLDGKEVAFGAHDSIDVAKSNFGLTVAGESVSFKNLRVWEALPNKNWESTKAKLVRAKTQAQ
jgi:hypothetical protein